MMARVVLGIVIAVVCAMPAFAQGRFEVQPFVGYKFGGSVPVGSNSLDIAKIGFDSSMNYGVSATFNATESLGFEFAWNRQATNAVGRLNGGGDHPEKFDANLDQYHGNFVLTFSPDEKLRPFLLFGAGVSRAAAGGDSRSNFSFAVGGGVKYFFTDHMGVRLQARYTPTYLFTTPGGTWCNWWGVCWVIPNDHYMSQGDVTAGWILSF